MLSISHQESIDPQNSQSHSIKNSSFEVQKLHIGQVLTKLSYPSFQNYCVQCTEEINQNDAIRCRNCYQKLHKGCLTEEDSRKDGKCRFCLDGNCLKCKKPFEANQQTIKCSICWKNQHVECWGLPLSLLQHSKPFYQQLNLKNFNRTVCEKCCILWRISLLVKLFVKIEGKQYYFCSVDHPSPIHFVWQNSIAKMEQKSQSIGQMEVQSVKRNIENILSVHLTPPLDILTISCIYKFIQSPNKQDVSKILFLVKWQGKKEPLWENLEVVQSYKDLTKNFFLQLSFNIMKFQQTQIQHINSFLERFKISEEINKNLYMLGSKQTSDFNPQLHQIYSRYLDNKNQHFKYEFWQQPIFHSMVCSLLNTIYFSEKNTNPILFLTEEQKIKTWKHNFRNQCPFHKVITISGPSTSIKSKHANYLFSIKEKKHIFYNTIYLVDYDYYSQFAIEFNIQENIKRCALLVMEQNLSIRARTFYQYCKIGKMILECNKVENHNITESLFSRHSFSKKSQLSLLDQEMKNSLNLIMKKQKENTFLEETFDELQRLVFLHYIMAFGLNHENQKKLYQGIINFDKLAKRSFQARGEQTFRVQLKQYANKFLAVVYQNSMSYQSPKQIIQHYCFKFNPRQIFDRIIIINQMNLFYSKYSQEQKANPSQNKKGDGDKMFSLILILCEILLKKGFGRWEAISYNFKIWEEGTEGMALHQFYCKKYENVTQEQFIKIIETLISKLATDLRKPKMIL